MPLPSSAPTLRDPKLLRDLAFIGGDWVSAADRRRFAVTNPADGSLLGHVPDLGPAETRRAIALAEAAGPAWSSRPARERSQILRRWFDLLLTHQEDLALLISLECGKPLTEARGEVLYGAGFVEWFAEEAKRIYGDVIPAPQPGRRLLALKQPVGVVAAITPWNFPLAMITRKCAPALAAGCTVVIKPAEETPLSALALAELAQRAGFPTGVLNIVTTAQPEGVGGALMASAAVRKLSFTGSTAVGKLLMAQAAQTVKKVSLELGGNAPFIVFDDADLEAAVQGAMISKYRNTGQTCVCSNRFLVQDGIHDAFVARLAERVAGLKVGPGQEPGVQQGPLINQAGLNKVDSLVSDAVAHGARVVCGGARHSRGGTFYLPTVLADVTPAMRIANEEIFGPVAPVMRFSSEGEALALANDTPYGLAAYVYARDLGRVWRVAEGLEYGMVGVNEGVISSEAAPFGGVKQSGIGREGSKYGIDDFIEIKYLCLGGL